MSWADGAARPRLDVRLGSILGRRIEDGLDPLLLAALHQAPVLREIDGDPLARDDVVLAPDPGVADQHHPLLHVIVLGPIGRAHAAVPRDDPDVARGHHALDTPGLGVRVDLHPVGILGGIVLTRHHIALEDGQSLFLETLERVGVHGHRRILAIGGGRGRGRRLGRSRLGPRRPREDERSQGEHADHRRRPAQAHGLARLVSGLAGVAATRRAPPLTPAKVARTGPRMTVTSSDGRVSRPLPVTTTPARYTVTGSSVQARLSELLQRSRVVSSLSPSLETSTMWPRSSTSRVCWTRSPSSPVIVHFRVGSSMASTTLRRSVLP